MPFDPDNGADSPALDAILRGPAAALTAVTLVAGSAARASGWSTRAAAALARRWPKARSVVLVDLDFERPALHEACGVPNDEGVADIIEFGASLHRVAVPAAAGEFAVLPAGIAVGDTSALLESRQWPRMLQEAAGRHETLLLYVPADASGAASVVQLAGAALVLAHADEADAVMARLLRPFAVLAVATPPPGETPASAAVTVRDDEQAIAHATPLTDSEFERIRLPTEPVARQELMAELRRRQRDARMSPASAAGVFTQADAVVADVTVPSSGGEAAREARVEAAADDVALETIVPAQRATEPSKRRRAHPLWWTIGIVLVVSLIAGAWHFLRNRAPEPTGAEPEPQPPVMPPVAIVPPPNSVEYAVALEAHQNLATAFERVDALSAAQPDVSFYIAPLERSGTLYYHVMAGPVADSGAAAVMRDTLVARRVKTAAAPTDVRYAPLALLIGDYSARDDATAQVGELRRLDIPSYIVVGVAADGQPLYRVYVGSFAGPAEADVVRQLLRAAGIRDTLVNRSRSITP